MSILTLLLALSVFAGVQEPAEEPTEQQAPAEESQAVPEKPSFKWMRSDGEMESQRFGGYGLSRLKGFTERGPWVETETETVVQTDKKVHTITRAYRNDPQGRRRLVEVVEETIEYSPNGEAKGVKTTSAADLDGRLKVSRRETQEVRLDGEDASQTVLTVELVSVNGRLKPVERLEQKEQKSGEGSAELERDLLTVDGNGRWQLSEKREGSIEDVDGETLVRETVYRLDGNRELTVFEQIAGREWTDEDGSSHRVSDKYLFDFDGEPTLNERVNITRQVLEDGSYEVVQEISGSPNSGVAGDLSPQQRIIVHESGDETETTVEMVDIAGKMRAVSSFKTTTRDSDNKKVKKVKD
jgi:hypothetical protein